MKSFNVEIIETLSTVVSIEADTLEEARDMANKQYRNGDIILDADNSDVSYEVK